MPRSPKCDGKESSCQITKYTFASQGGQEMQMNIFSKGESNSAMLGKVLDKYQTLHE